MNYRKIASNIKGMHVIWKDNKIFPDYTFNSGSYVSQKRINKAIRVVVKILEDEENKIKKAFKELANKKYKGKKITINFDFKSSIERVKNAKVNKESDLVDGESDYYQIWINSNQTSDDLLIGVLLHESLHYLATFNNKDICEKDEHYVMGLLGEIF
jgi:hypothetical protein